MRLLDLFLAQLRHQFGFTQLAVQLFFLGYGLFRGIGGAGAGLGLGLVICRDIAAEFKGGLTARNASGAGACFTLTVPLWQASLHPTTPETP